EAILDDTRDFFKIFGTGFCLQNRCDCDDTELLLWILDFQTLELFHGWFNHLFQNLVDARPHWETILTDGNIAFQRWCIFRKPEIRWFGRLFYLICGMAGLLSNVLIYVIDTVSRVDVDIVLAFGIFPKENGRCIASRHFFTERIFAQLYQRVTIGSFERISKCFGWGHNFLVYQPIADDD